MVKQPHTSDNGDIWARGSTAGSLDRRQSLHCRVASAQQDAGGRVDSRASAQTIGLFRDVLFLRQSPSPVCEEQRYGTKRMSMPRT